MFFYYYIASNNVFYILQPLCNIYYYYYILQPLCNGKAVANTFLKYFYYFYNCFVTKNVNVKVATIFCLQNCCNHYSIAFDYRNMYFEIQLIDRYFVVQLILMANFGELLQMTNKRQKADINTIQNSRQQDVFIKTNFMIKK